MKQLWESIRRSRQCVGEWLLRLLEHLRTCRECRGPVSPLDEICPSCGVRRPVTISVSPGLLATSLGSLVFLVWLYTT